MKAPLPTVTIQRDVSNVYDYLASEQHDPGWARSFGVRRTVENQLIAFTARNIAGTPVTGTYTLEPAGDSTRVIIDYYAQPTGFKKLLKPLMAGSMRREAQDDLAQLASELTG